MEVSRPECWTGSPSPSPGVLPNPEIEPRSPALQVDSLPAEPQGKPKNTGVGSLSLLQGIFLIQESNPIYCITGALYHLSYQGGPSITWEVKVAQSCPTLGDPMDYTVPGILQTRILE